MRVQFQVIFWLTAAISLVLAVLLLSDVLLPFVSGFVISYALNPIAARLETLGLSRVVATAFIMTFLVLVAAMLLIVLVPILVDQARQLIAVAPEHLEKISPVIDHWMQGIFGAHVEGLDRSFRRAVDELAASWKGSAGLIAQSLWNQGTALINLLAMLLVTPVVVFYLLCDWPRMTRAIDQWLPRDHAPTIRRLVGEIDGAMSAFFRGQGVVCIVLAIFYAVGLTLAGLRYGLLIGATAGALSFIPFVGWGLGLLVASAFALFENWPSTGPLVAVLILFGLGQVLDSVLLAPRIVGSRLGLHPVWLIFALFVFSYLFGFVGTLLAVPLAAAIAVLVRFALELYLSSAIYRGADDMSEDCEREGAVDKVAEK